MGYYMGIIKESLGIGALVLALAGCIKEDKKALDLKVDLNNDGINERITYIAHSGDAVYAGEHFDDYTYLLAVELSNPDGSYKEPQLIMQSGVPFDSVEFRDMNEDGLLDLIYFVGKGNITNPLGRYIALQNKNGAFMSPNIWH